MQEEKSFSINWRAIDWWLIAIIFVLAVFSYLGIRGASPLYGEDTKQLIWYGLGIAVMLGVMFIPGRVYYMLAPILYGLSILLLIGVLIFAEPINGSKSWFILGPPSFRLQFQPSELAKLVTIFTVARFLTDRRRRIEDGDMQESFWGLWPVFILFALPMALIVVEPDLGTTLGMAVTLLAMLTVSVRPRYTLTVVGVYASGLLALIFLYFFFPQLFFKIIKEYQWRRITAFLDRSIDPSNPDQYQLYYSLQSIGSGEFWGRSVPEQELLTFNRRVPFAQTDFVFSVIGERFGFLGSALLIMLYFFLLYRMIRIAMQTTSTFAHSVIAGIVGMFTFQIYENIGMTIGIMPITGITLPFLSYGGSSLLINLFAVGVVLGFSVRKESV
ncbi:MAG: Cell division protein FtsW [Candidatus Carbobacillus altaicus]|uniref:Cell division protein FtsW n=1 Tax=Candidatus Carbonibacillus altaicus TaxID=2163959 RepID=A0A2R6Y234_9BACL|nr:MAG: Cell division protein FtsW [Candidatus Carbobacillus altaicus]